MTQNKPGCAEQPGLSNALHQVENFAQQPDAGNPPEIHLVF
jgi:hypothetical protein